MRIIQFLTGLSLLAAPLAPIVAHAESHALSLGVTTGVSVTGENRGSTTGVSSSGSANTSLEGSIVVTHESVVADEHANENAIFLRSTTTGNATSTNARLRAQVHALVQKDANISSVVLSEEEVSVSYEEPARLFGFIKVRVPVHVSVYASGNTDVSYPWYRFLLATEEESLSVRAKAIADEHVNAETSTTLSGDVAIKIADALAEMLKSEANARASVDAKTE